MLQVKNLRKYFGGVKAVDDCSFEIKEGKITALIGPNGSGKTTVFNLVSGILNADNGKIIFDAYDITNKSPEYIANIGGLGISRMFQQARLFNNLTVKENLLLAFDNEDTKFWKNLLGLNKSIEKKEESIKEILKLMRLWENVNYLCKSLSYGQKRLLELARTILKPHKLLMLDEPVAGVTPILRNEIARILLNLREKGDTILLIEHDINFIFEISDRIIVMDEGTIIAQGRPQDIKDNKKVLDAYLGD